MRLLLILVGAVPAALLSYVIGAGLAVHPVVPFVVLGPTGVWLALRLFDGDVSSPAPATRRRSP